VTEEGESSNAMSGVRAFLYSDVMSVCARVRTFINNSSAPWWQGGMPSLRAF
jgi:hypothetical protein